MGHWRATVESLILDGTLPALVAADIDLANMFGTCEWPAIRAAINDEFSDIRAWTEWHHTNHAITVLPCGDEILNDRGAEQGDGLGSFQACAVLASHRPKWTRSSGDADSSTVPVACDEWYIDDGQVFVRPQDFDPWLQALDRALAKFGASRGTNEHANAKSTCRLLCSPGEHDTHEGWATPYVRHTTRVLGPSESTSALGAPIGGPHVIREAMRKSNDKARATRSAILKIEHSPTELVLARLCGDVAKVQYNLRLNGDCMDGDLLSEHDRSLRSTLDFSLGGDLTDIAWSQATLGVKHGGLGLREARTVALPAFVASRVASRPHVLEMAKHMEALHHGAARAITKAFDERTDRALEALTQTLDTTTGTTLVNDLKELSEKAQNNWNCLFDEHDPATAPDSTHRRQNQPGAAPNLVPRDEDGDAEHPNSGHRPGVLHVQRSIMSLLDVRYSALQRNDLATLGNDTDIRRIGELVHPDTDHTWLWSLSPHKGPVLDSTDHTEAVRLRLGIAGPTDPVACLRCGKAAFNSNAAHALCCSKGEITRGHNRVAKIIHDVAASIDPTTELEAPGLIPNTRLRPADVLTGALGVGRHALDIGICSPDAHDAGTDCVEAMYRSKSAYYEPYRDSLDRQVITYLPLIWSAYGRPHAQTTSTLRTLSNRLTRRRGDSGSEWRYGRLRTAISVELMRRAAACVRSCYTAKQSERVLDLE
jgi:hypothetical protein